jgi:hypothetical protein
MTARPTSPLTATQLVDEYFIENRNRLLEIAAFLDRIDRADPEVAASDFRMRAFAEGLAALTGAAPERLAHIQMLLSDPDATPLPALDRKGAVGAYDRSRREPRS